MTVFKLFLSLSLSFCVFLTLSLSLFVYAIVMGVHVCAYNHKSEGAMGGYVMFTMQPSHEINQDLMEMFKDSLYCQTPHNLGLLLQSYLRQA